MSNLKQQRALLAEFSVLNLKIRFKGTYLGLLWAGLEPLLIFLLLYTVFTSIRIGTGEHFAIYLLSGILFYHLFSRGTVSGMHSLRSNAGILKTLKIKREIFPVSSTLTMAILTIVEVGVLLLLMPFFQFIPDYTLVFFPISIILLLLLILGFSYILSIVNVFIKDIQPIWAVLVQALLFVSPIFWHLKDSNELLLTIQSINPLGQLIEINHILVISREIPPLSDWLYTAGIIFGTLFFGFYLFQKFEKKVIAEL